MLAALAPVVAEYVPAEHPRHIDDTGAPAVVEYMPAPHEMQAVEDDAPAREE